MTPQRENLKPHWKEALDRLGVEVVMERLARTGTGEGAEFLGVLPGFNRNPCRKLVEQWVAKTERRNRRNRRAVSIGGLVVGVLTVAIAIYAIVRP